VIGLPDQLFYNTGISTYIWIVTNRKRKERRGRVQLINGTDFAWKMKKSLGDKRKQIGDGTEGVPNHIDVLTKLYGGFKHDVRNDRRRDSDQHRPQTRSEEERIRQQDF
jgi:type I restriction enzyme M protein